MLPMILALVAGQSFACKVVSVHDGDGPFHCANGVSVRLAGVQAPDFESAEPCRQGRAEFVCSNRAAADARDQMRALIEGQTLDCVAVGNSYRRTVATCSLAGRDLSCLAVTNGIAARWPRYDRAGKLIHCAQRTTLRSYLGSLFGERSTARR